MLERKRSFTSPLKQLVERRLEKGRFLPLSGTSVFVATTRSYPARLQETGTQDRAFPAVWLGDHTGLRKCETFHHRGSGVFRTIVADQDLVRFAHSGEDGVDPSDAVDDQRLLVEGGHHE